MSTAVIIALLRIHLDPQADSENKGYRQRDSFEKIRYEEIDFEINGKLRL
jgi:hypothetical protein